VPTTEEWGHVFDAELQVALPLGIAAVLLDKRLDDPEAVAVGGERLVQPVLSDEQITYLVVADRKIALPERLAWSTRYRFALTTGPTATMLPSPDPLRENTP
jgi:hypothetical protein